MEKGRLVFRVQFDGHTKLELTSAKRLNNIDDMTTVSATVLNSEMGKLVSQAMGKLVSQASLFQIYKIKRL